MIVLLIVIGAVVFIGPLLILRLPTDTFWARRGEQETESEPRELPEVLRRPLRGRFE